MPINLITASLLYIIHQITGNILMLFAWLPTIVWCPHKAIYGGLLTGKEERYHHLQIKLAEMLQKRKA